MLIENAIEAFELFILFLKKKEDNSVIIEDHDLKRERK